MDRIKCDAEVRNLRPQVMELLVYLANRPGQVVSADELLRDLWDGRIVAEGSVYNCVSELRAALATEKSTELAIETIPKKGYRFVAPVTPHEPATAGTRRRLLPIGAIVVIAVITSLTVWLQDRVGNRPQIRSLAVLPLENHSPDPAQDAYFTDGMTEALIARLSRISGLKVISRTSSMQLKDSDLTIPEIATALDVDGVIEGSVLTAGREVRITLQLIDGKSDTHLWTSSYIRDFDDILDLQEEIANSMAVELRIQLADAGGSQRVTQPPTPRAVTDNPDAYRAYLKGRFYFNKFGEENFRTALDYYEEATTIDPTFALAYAAMAEACMQPIVFHTGMRTLDDCQRDARRATALDDHLAEAFAVRGSLELLTWQWQDSELSFKRAVELDPNSVMARQWYSLTLRATRRFDESLAEIRRAEELDPLNLFVKTMVSWPLYNQGQYKEALAQLDDVIDMDPGFMLAHYNQGLVYIQMQHPDKVYAAAGRVAELAGQNALEARLLTASGHAIAGEHNKTAEILVGVERDAGEIMAAWIASIYLLMGEEDVALARLERGVRDKAIDMLSITEPQFNTIRQHPRFQAISREMGFTDDSGDSPL